jgi:hypothetical protein
MKPTLACLALLIAVPGAFADQPPVQIALGPLLNARIVTTLTAGRLVPWRDALDGVTSGEATRAAALRIGQPFSLALPDDGVFPATDRHPLVKLAFSNAEGGSNQVRRSLSEDAYAIPVPPGRYGQFWIFVMSGNGESTLRLRLSYADGHGEESSLVIPDWYFPVKDGEARRVNLASDLGKWSSSSELMEKDHHYLHGFDLGPDPRRVLISVRVSKTAKAVLTLWGATAVAAAP